MAEQSPPDVIDIFETLQQRAFKKRGRMNYTDVSRMQHQRVVENVMAQQLYALPRTHTPSSCTFQLHALRRTLTKQDGQSACICVVCNEEIAPPFAPVADRVIKAHLETPACRVAQRAMFLWHSVTRKSAAAEIKVRFKKKKCMREPR